MRHYWKYLFLVLLLPACRDSNNMESSSGPALFPRPIAYNIDTTNGYKVNPLNGDTIHSLLQYSGDTAITGVSISVKRELLNSGNPILPVPISNSIPVKKVAENNFQLTPETQLNIIVDSFKTSPQNLTHTVFPVNGNTTSLREMPPVKALPPKSKENALADIQYLSLEQGLNYAYISDVLADKRGNIWTSTDGTGVSRYDGVHFFHYTEMEGLSSNRVYSILEDRDGKILIGTAKGLNIFDGKNFTSFPNGPAANKIFSLQEDDQNNIWLSTNKGLICYTGSQFIQYSVKDGLPSDTISECTLAKNGQLWVLTARGVCKFNGNSFTTITLKDEAGMYLPKYILADKNNNIWLGTSRGIIKFDQHKFSLDFPLKGNADFSILLLFEDHNGYLWISTTNGIYQFDGKKSIEYNLKEGLSNNRVYGIDEDDNGNIWCGTDGGGLNKIVPGGFVYPFSNELLVPQKVRPVVSDSNGVIWFGTIKGDFGSFSGQWIFGQQKKLYYYKLPNSFLNSSHRSLLQDTKGNIWIGPIEKGLVKFDGKTFYSLVPGGENSLETILGLLEDKKGNIWFSSDSRGLFMYDGANLYHYSLPGFTIFSIVEDDNCNIWLGTDGGGIIKFDGTSFIEYGEKEGFFGKQVTTLLKDRSNNIWIGTQGLGLCRFDGKKFTYYTKKEGLVHNGVWSMREDSMQNLWVGTDKGLSRLIPASIDSGKKVSNYLIYNYGLQNGLQAIDFSLNGACIDNQNHLWLSSGNNIVSKDLNIPFKSEHASGLQLNFIEINDRFYDFRNAAANIPAQMQFNSIVPFTNCPQDLTISYDQNHLAFHFSAIDWTAPEKIKYTYRLVGADKEWSVPSETPMADYRNLSHGSYIFKVRAAGQSGVWTEPVLYRFEIRAAWWQTWWFKTFLFLAAALTLLFISRLIYLSRLRKQKSEMEKQLAVQLERQRISTEMHDDIGAGLSGVRLLTEITKNKLRDSDSTNEIDQIYQSVGDISAKMREVIWSLNTENDSLSSLIGYLQSQARLMMEHYTAQLHISIPELIPDINMNGETRRQIYLSVKEALHNIIKHSEAGEVNLVISCNQKLVIVLADNGKGIDAGKMNNGGNGLKNMQKRMQDINGTLTINYEKGLILTFEVPFN